jgi:hypothetical protein
LACFLLPDRCTFKRVSIRSYIRCPETNKIASPQFAVDCQIEHGEVTQLAFDLKLGTYRPNVLWTKGRLGTDQLALIPRNALVTG